jgi:hypothetical protein
MHNYHIVVSLYEIISKLIYKYCDKKESIPIHTFAFNQRITSIILTKLLNRSRKMFYNWWKNSITQPMHRDVPIPGRAFSPHVYGSAPFSRSTGYT